MCVLIEGRQLGGGRDTKQLKGVGPETEHCICNRCQTKHCTGRVKNKVWTRGFHFSQLSPPPWHPCCQTFLPPQAYTFCWSAAISLKTSPTTDQPFPPTLQGLAKSRGTARKASGAPPWWSSRSKNPPSLPWTLSSTRMGLNHNDIGVP